MFLRIEEKAILQHTQKTELMEFKAQRKKI